MLHNFFQLNTPFIRLKSENDLVVHFETSSTLENVLYEPDQIGKDSRKLFNYKHFKNVSFSKTTFDSIDLKECTFTDCLLIGTKFQKCEFHRCQFRNCNMWKCEINECYIDPKTFNLDNRYKKSHSNIAVHLYQELYKNACNTHQPAHAAEADYNFRIWKRAQLKYDYKTSEQINYLQYALFSLKDWIFQISAGYGHRPLRFFIFSVGFFIIISTLNYQIWEYLGLKNENEVIEIPTFVSSLYYSLVVMTTLGFGDIVPSTSVGMIISVFESILGLIWFSILAAIVIKRLIR